MKAVSLRRWPECLCTWQWSGPADSEASSRVTFNPELHRSKAAVEGPFTAARVQSTSVYTLSPNRAVKLQEAPSDPRLISDHEFIGLGSCRGPTAKLESVGSTLLSALLQTTGEADRSQTFLSNTKTSGPFHAGKKVSSDTTRPFFLLHRQWWIAENVVWDRIACRI